MKTDQIPDGFKCALWDKFEYQAVIHLTRWLLSRQRPAELDALFGHWQQATPECAARVPKPLRPVVSEWALLRGNRSLALRLQAQTLLESFTPASYQHYISTTLAQLSSLEAQTDLMERWLASLGELFFRDDLRL